MSDRSRSSLWDNVRIDADATDDLVRQLVATAAALGEAASLLDGDGEVVAQDWGGPHRDAFDDDRARIAESARAVSENLLATAAAASALLAAGEGEQHLRMRLRYQAQAEQECVPGVAC